ncbi:MAG UNVERIFIED_CONTAM: hypothetical protein LVR29_33935 [Microcystis novacekii LVE1205-3]|jgi:hypothetical protein
MPTNQSLNTHLLNGLFPANLIEKRLEKLNTTVRRVVKEIRAQVGDRWVYSPRFREIPLLAFSRDAGEIYRD